MPVGPSSGAGSTYGNRRLPSPLLRSTVLGPSSDVCTGSATDLPKEAVDDHVTE